MDGETGRRNNVRNDGLSASVDACFVLLSLSGRRLLIAPAKKVVSIVPPVR